MNNKLMGRAWLVGDDIDTDLIIAARYLNTFDEKELAVHCLEDVIPNLVRDIEKNDILVAGKNFGCGSSREHAPVAIKAMGFSCVIAESFARIFYRNAINIGLPILTIADISQKIQQMNDLEVIPETGLVVNCSTGKEYSSESYPEEILQIIKAGGLIAYVREKVQKNV